MTFAWGFYYCSVTKLWPTLCDPMDSSTPGLPVLHHLLELANYVYWVGDAIQASHPLSSPSPPALNLSQHQGLFPMSWLFTSGGQTIRASASASVLPMNIQHWFPNSTLKISVYDLASFQQFYWFKIMNFTVYRYVYRVKSKAPYHILISGSSSVH